jgi:uncharacterized protein YecT (DUF1311 family)
MLKYVLACSLFLGVMFTARAEDPPLLCLTAGGTDELKCLNKELDKANITLADYLAAAQQQIDKQNTGTPRIEYTQKVWLKYRDVQYGDVEKYWEAGTYRYRAELTCDIEATQPEHMKSGPDICGRWGRASRYAQNHDSIVFSLS